MQNSEAMEDRQTDGEELQFEPAQRLAELLAATAVDDTHPRPNRLSHDAITLMPELFQPRGMSEKHVGDLVRAILNAGEVEPLTLLAAGDRAILIDGHHRLQAYQLAKKMTGIPVKYFEGTPQEAVLEAGKANSRAKLPMTSQERQNYGWRLVLLGTHSKANIAQASGVSEAQVANMRVVRKKLGGDAFGFPSWWHARRGALGPEEEMVEEDRDQWKQELADRFADRLAREFSTKLADRPEIAAMALATYFGRRLPEVFHELRTHLSEDALADNDEF